MDVLKNTRKQVSQFHDDIVKRLQPLSVFGETDDQNLPEHLLPTFFAKRYLIGDMIATITIRSMVFKKGYSTELMIEEYNHEGRIPDAVYGRSITKQYHAEDLPQAQETLLKDLPSFVYEVERLI